MVKRVGKIKLGFMCGICAFSIAACAPSHHMPAESHLGYGYDNAAYGYDYVSDQSSYGYEYDQSGYQYGQVSSRYGDAQFIDGTYSGALRGPCNYTAQNCGMMQVVPVYPIYQVATYPEPQPAPIVDVPTITLPPAQPEPIVISEPDLPVYEPPVAYWPEPETPITTWEPKRK